MNKLFALGFALFVLHSAQAAPFPMPLDAAEIQKNCEAGLKAAKEREAKLAAMPARPTARYLSDIDDLSVLLEDYAGPLYLLNNVHPDKSIRTAAEQCTLKFDAFLTAYGQNEAIFQRLKATAARDKLEQRTKLLAGYGFEDSGVSLPADKRPRAKAINDRITALGVEFDKAIREDKTQIAFTAEELAGVPEGALKRAKKDASGKLMLGLDTPSYIAVMEFASNPAARERMWRARQQEGGAENLKRLDELAKLRREYAALFGAQSYAEFVLRRRMAGSAQTVETFLGEVRAKVTEREKKDIEELREAKAKHTNTPLTQTQFNRWDTSYYTERVKKEKYALDREEFRKHFPPEASLQFAFKLAERIFGVRYVPVEQQLWHPDARAFAVEDIATKKRLGHLFVDLYPREDKYNHAAVWSYKNVATRVNRLPQAGLVVNFNRDGLSLDELETLLHEFGHSIHALFSQTRFNAQGGTNVQLDFVEAPSQMLEEWARDPRAIALFAEVCPTCKPVPAEMLEKAERSRSFGKGIRYARQLQYASYDFALNGRTARDPLELWKEIERATPLGYVDGTIFPAGFGHLAGGYAAGYYSYLWSEVIAEDLKTAFVKDRLSPATGLRYRNMVLAQGGQQDARELVRQFLNRPLSNEAFFTFLAK